MTDPELLALARWLCREVGTTVEELTDRNHGRHVCRRGSLPYLRGLVWWLIRQRMDGDRRRWSYPQIARAFGVRHTTVLTAVKRHEQGMVKQEVSV
jgi:chromosomal replication initiation ATPase DnaA